MNRYPAPVSGPAASTTLSLSEPTRVVGAVTYRWGAVGTSFCTYCRGCGACTTVDVLSGRCRGCY